MTDLTTLDIEAIGNVCPRLYAAVGWGPDKVPNWEAFRSCCHSQAVLVPMGSGAATPIPLEAFIAGMEQQRTSGALTELSEIEIGRATEGYGNLASVRSTFVATIDGVARRGVTFAHLVRDEERWVILCAAWENEREHESLPVSLI